MFASEGVVKPIRVTENDTNYLVEIPASEKVRASRIIGRRWDPGLVAWVYPKNLDCYESLKAEFSRDADVFDIRKPKRKPVPEFNTTPLDEDGDSDFENEWKELSEKTTNIHSTFEDVTQKLDVLVATVKGLEDTNHAIEQMVIAQNLEKTLSKDREHGHAQKEEIDQKAMLEKFLKDIAYESSGKDESLRRLLDKHWPISKPERFIMRTHEHLLHALAEMSGDPEPKESSFAKYVTYVKDNHLVSDSRDKKVPATLFMLNTHRNQVVHSKHMPEYELTSRAISYLMGVAFIWRDVASEPVEDL